MSLLDEHDALLVDLDGVVHLRPLVIPGAVEGLQAARAAGLGIAFVTNNASRTAAAVAAGLRDFGVAANADEVVTSSSIAAAVLALRLPPGARVLVVGGEGLTDPVSAAGLVPVSRAEDDPVAVVQGWSPDIDWGALAEAAVVLALGVPWIATNLDRTLPSPRGPLPGNGSLVAALACASGREPESVGKPAPAMFVGAADRLGAQRPLVVGDRLDTDIAGGLAAGFATLCVLTGVSTPRDLLTAPADRRPHHLAANLGGLRSAPSRAALTGDGARCGDVSVDPTGDVHGDPASGDGLDGLRAACALAWAGRLAPSAYDRVLDALRL